MESVDSREESEECLDSPRVLIVKARGTPTRSPLEDGEAPHLLGVEGRHCLHCGGSRTHHSDSLTFTQVVMIIIYICQSSYFTFRLVPRLPVGRME